MSFAYLSGTFHPSCARLSCGSYSTAHCGDVTDVRIPIHPDGSPRLYGFISFGTHEAMEKALGLDGWKLQGRCLRVEIARPRPAFDRASGER